MRGLFFGQAVTTSEANPRLQDIPDQNSKQADNNPHVKEEIAIREQEQQEPSFLSARWETENHTSNHEIQENEGHSDQHRQAPHSL